MSNDEMQSGWDQRALEWVRNSRIYDTAYAPIADAIMAAADVAEGQRVLDVGCGTGALLEESVGLGASAVGVDISDTMAAAARSRVPAATVLVADAQSADLLALAPGQPFDRVVSRFGVMFFSDPGAAFTNLRTSSVEGGQLAFACWRADAAPMFGQGLRAISDRLTDVPAGPVVGEPGPLGFGDEARIREVLTGWSDVAVRPMDSWADYSIDGSDGVEERLETTLAGRVGDALRAEVQPRVTAAEWESLLDEVRDDIRSDIRDGSVKVLAKVWLVTATA